VTITFESVDELLASARHDISRLSPLQARDRTLTGALIVDIRPAWQREVDGEIPESYVVERNHLEWRLHPSSGANLPVARVGQEWIVVCAEGYTSSLAASALVSLGLPAYDIDGGIHAWRAAGLPVVPGPTPVERQVRAATPAG
jgi:rhodanese-related sulfurtransferase